MTTEQWISDQNKAIKLMSDAKTMLPIIQPTHNSQVQRIFDKGIAGDGSKIGNYSNRKTGIYINPKYNIGSFQPEGKHGEKVFKKTGQPHKTKYFDNYKGYRTEINKETSYVNLRHTENLKIDYTNSLRFSNGRVITSVNGAANVGKSEGIIDKYGVRTWQLTTEEQTKLAERFGAAFIKNLRRD